MHGRDHRAAHGEVLDQFRRGRDLLGRVHHERGKAYVCPFHPAERFRQRHPPGEDHALRQAEFGQAGGVLVALQGRHRADQYQNGIVTFGGQVRQRANWNVRQAADHVGAQIGHGLLAGKARVFGWADRSGVVALGRDPHRDRRQLLHGDAVEADALAHPLRLDDGMVAQGKRQPVEQETAGDGIHDAEQPGRPPHGDQALKGIAQPPFEHRIAHPEQAGRPGDLAGERIGDGPQRLVADLDQVVGATRRLPGKFQPQPVLPHPVAQPAKFLRYLPARDVEPLGAALVHPCRSVPVRAQAPVDLQPTRDEVVGKQFDEIDAEGRIVVRRHEQHAHAGQRSFLHGGYRRTHLGDLGSQIHDAILIRRRCGATDRPAPASGAATVPCAGACAPSPHGRPGSRRSWPSRAE